MKTPPTLYDHDAEEALAGAALLDNNVFILADVQPDDFDMPDVRALWKEGQRLAMDGSGVDLITLSDAAIRAIGGPSRYGDLINNCPSCARYESYAAIVRDRAEQRRLLALAEKIGKASYIADPDQRQSIVKHVRRQFQETDHDHHGDVELLSADDILSTVWPEPVWAIPDLLPAGLCILAGKPKLGKSWLALQIAQAVATGGMTLDRRVERGPILYLALEDPPARLKDRMTKQLWPTGAQADFLTIGKFGQQIGDLVNGGGERIAHLIEQRGYRMVTIDTLSRSIVGDQNDADRMTRALEPVQVIAHKYNCVVILVDHHSKGAGADTDMVTDILGSTAKGAMADCIWSLYRERGKTGAKLSITGREVIEQTLQLVMHWQTGCWQVEGDGGLEITVRRREILDALKRLGPSQLIAVADATGQPKSHTHSRLQDLVNAGLVRRYESGDDTILYEVVV
jgi:hypothetical protein